MLWSRFIVGRFYFWFMKMFSYCWFVFFYSCVIEVWSLGENFKDVFDGEVWKESR